MNLRKLARWSSTVCLSALTLTAQETNEVEQLKKQLKELSENFERVQQEQRRQIEALTRQIEALQQQANDATKEPVGKLAGAKGAVTPPPPLAEAQKWSPSQPITLARAGSAYVNVSFDALMDFGGSTASDPSARLQLGDHDPMQRGFTLATTELALEGAVDPYFKGFANFVFKLDKNNETKVELEETYLTTTGLPANFQVKGGQFFAAFGRQNSQHAHQWAFVDQPLVLNRAFGPDGLRNLGAQISWLAPTPFYTELFLTVLDSQGEGAFGFRNRGEDDGTGTDRIHGRATIGRTLRGPGDLLFVPRIASSFELTDQQTLVLGASAAFGPNATGSDAHTQIYGADVYWKWKSLHHHGGFPFVAWQTEALYQRYAAGADLPAGLPAEALRDRGFYTQLLWGFKPHWVGALRGEYVTGNRGAFDAMDIFRGERTRVSPNLTWHPSEFSKFRLQYNYDRGQNIGEEHSVWVQVEFQLGAHAAHKF